MEIINGKQIAQQIINNLKQKEKPEKIFAAVLVGDNAASESFVKQKEKVAKELGVDFRIYKFPKNSANDTLRKDLLKLVLSKRVGGLIVQLPLPSHINPDYVLNIISREKDVDVLGERALGAFYNNRNIVLPPSVSVLEHIINQEKIDLLKSNVAIVGLGRLIGKPISLWLEKKVRNLYLLDKGSDLEILKQADLIILGTGQSNIVNAKMLKNKTILVDFGYGRNEQGNLSGDFNAIQTENRDLGSENFIKYTPTPGGTGPILVAALFENFYKINGRD